MLARRNSLASSPRTRSAGGRQRWIAPTVAAPGVRLCRAGMALDVARSLSLIDRGRVTS